MKSSFFGASQVAALASFAFVVEVVGSYLPDFAAAFELELFVAGQAFY